MHTTASTPEKSAIAVFSLAYHPFEGGAEVAVREITKRLPMRRFFAYTLRFDAGWVAEETIGNVEIIRLGKGIRAAAGTRGFYGNVFSKIRYIFQAYAVASRRHRAEPFAAIWAVMASYGGIAAFFFKLRHPRVPMLLTLQEGDSPQHLAFGKFGLVGLWGMLVMKKADYIQAISGYLRDFALSRNVRAAIEVVPNGVDSADFSAPLDPRIRREIRSPYGGDFLIVTTSRLVPKNGTDILIAAISAVLQKHAGVRCIIVGDGPDRRHLEQIVRVANLQGKISFAGHVPYDSVPLYLKMADLFVRPSRSEGLGNSFLEAMAAGLPAIGTPVGGIPDFLKDGETGFLAAPENAASVAEKIIYAIEHPEEVGSIATRGQALVRERYSWDGVATAFDAIFNKLESVAI